jgi:hypothetical protein
MGKKKQIIPSTQEKDKKIACAISEHSSPDLLLPQNLLPTSLHHLDIEISRTERKTSRKTEGRKGDCMTKA